MERMEEYRALLEDLEKAPEDLAGLVRRAGARARRERRRRRFGVTAVGLVSLAACFILLVNVCAPVALACGRVPVLRELVQAVIVSQSLSAAVEHDYVQLIGQERTVNGYTIRLEYVIADKQQVNVFFTVEGEPPQDGYFSAWVDVTTEDAPHHRIIGGLTQLGELDYVCIDFAEGTTPEHLDLTVTVEDPVGEAEELASCDFSLDLDPYLLALGRTVEVNQDFVIKGNTLTLSTVEIYPTHMRLNIEQDAGNADWLRSLELTIGEVERMDSRGLAATGGGKYGPLSLYTATSWYYDCKELTLTVTEATWLAKDREETVIDLETGEAWGLPEGVEFIGAVEDDFYDESAGMALLFRWENGSLGAPFSSQFRDEMGTVYNNTHTSASTGAVKGGVEISYGLGAFQGSKVILENSFSHRFTLAEPLILTVPVGES